MHRSRVVTREEAIVRIRANDVTLDLGGRTVENAVPNGMTMIWFSKFVVGERGGTRLRNASISNGHLISPGATGIGIDLTASKPYGPRSLEIAAVPVGGKVTDVFVATAHLIASMTISAGKRAILIDGKNNVIRNNRIVVDAATAIVAQGPGLVIENNVIEVQERLVDAEQARPDA